jgi:hypothetical protein
LNIFSQPLILIVQLSLRVTECGGRGREKERKKQEEQGFYDENKEMKNSSHSL